MFPSGHRHRVPGIGRHVVQRHASSLLVHVGQIGLGPGISLFGSPARPEIRF